MGEEKWKLMFLAGPGPTFWMMRFMVGRFS
jgi:hypothetical protein